MGHQLTSRKILKKFKGTKKILSIHIFQMVSGFDKCILQNSSKIVENY